MRKRYRITMELETEANIPDKICSSEEEANKFFEDNLSNIEDIKPDFVQIERVF